MMAVRTIVNRWSGATIWSGDATSAKDALRQARAAGSNLSGSDLSGSNLRGSNLRGSNLSGSDLRGSDLSGSDLRGSDLSGSDLRGSNLSDSNLSGSDLRDSNLRGSNLRGSNLRGSNLSGDKIAAAGEAATRSDGYEFRAFVLQAGGIKIKAGCRWFTPEEARAHWTTTRGGTRLGDESLAIVEHLERMATIAGVVR
jgi:uncharacterized protein YjbI with pentapeptide repeats